MSWDLAIAPTRVSWYTRERWRMYNANRLGSANTVQPNFGQGVACNPKYGNGDVAIKMVFETSVQIVCEIPAIT